MDGPGADSSDANDVHDPFDVLVRRTLEGRARPGRLFLGDDAFLLALSRHGRLARFVGGAVNGLLWHLPESLGLYGPHAVTRTEATHDPETLRIRYADVRGLAPFVRPAGFSLHLRVADRPDEVRLAFRSDDERAEAVELARAIRRRARAAGAEPTVFDPGGRTRLLSLDEPVDDENRRDGV